MVILSMCFELDVSYLIKNLYFDYFGNKNDFYNPRKGEFYRTIYLDHAPFKISGMLSCYL